MTQPKRPKSSIRPELLPALEPLSPAVVYSPDGIASQRAGCQYLAAHPELLPNDPDVEIQQLYISVPGNSHLRLRIYQPRLRTGQLPAVLWLHGGGMAIGIPEADEGQNLRFAKEIPSVVVAVDYRLAPEHPYPIPGNDCYEALCWLHENADRLGVNPQRIAVAGMSGGGNLALSIAIRARDLMGPSIAFLSLNSPMINSTADTPSALQDYDPRTLNRQGVLELWSYYVGKHPAEWTPYMDPSLDDLSGLPAVYAYAGELDPFRDDTVALASRLMSQGIAAELHIYPGCYHVFDAVAQTADISRYAVGEVIRALRDALSVPAGSTNGEQSPDP